MIRSGVALVAAAAGLAAATGFSAPSGVLSRESKPPAVKRVVDELVIYGVRSAFAYVSDGGHGYSATAGLGPPRTVITAFASAA